MKVTPLEHKIAEICAPLAEERGLEIVCVNVIGEGGSRSIQIMAEDPKTGNLGVDECASLSRSISALLDVEDPVDGAYRLEVSSPGIDRPLVRLKDFIRYKGFEAKLETNIPDETGQKRFRGIISEVEDGTITLETDQGTAHIAFDSLAKAKLVLTDALMKAGAAARNG